MEKRDGRKLNRQALEDIRIQAVRQVEAGESPEVVIKALGFTRGRIYEWIALYREGGLDALRSRKAPGQEPKSLTTGIAGGMRKAPKRGYYLSKSNSNC